jgi:hypothetical protein
MVHPYVKNFITNLFLHDSWIPNFVANVMVTNLTWETVAMDVISQLACAIAKLNAIVKIRK